MTLIKTSLLSLIAAIFKISYGLILSKLLAVYVGPAGVALIGQFQSVQSALSNISTAGFGQGLIKHLAEYRDQPRESASIFSTALKLVCILLFFVSLVLFFCAHDISVLIFQDPEYKLWLQGLAVSLVPSSIGTLIVASLNGLREIKSLTLVKVLSSCLNILLALILIPYWKLSGVVFVMLVAPFMITMISVWFLGRCSVFSWRWLREKIDIEGGKKLGKYTLMALTSAISIPLSHILIRNCLSSNISLDTAGLWTGLWRISEAYLMVITMTLSVYYLPKLSGIKDKKELIKEIKQGYKFILPIVFVLSSLIYLYKDWIIQILFTQEFIAMGELFFWQFVVGDFIKISCYLMGYVLVAKGMAKIFIVKEITISTLFVLFTYIFVSHEGLAGVTYSYVAVYVINFFWLIFIMKKYLSKVSVNV